MAGKNRKRKRLHRIVPANRTEGIAYVVCADHDVNAARGKLMQPREAPSVGCAIAAALQIKVRRRQRCDHYAGLCQLVRDPRDVGIAARREATGMAAQDRPGKARFKGDIGNQLQPIQIWLEPFVHMEIQRKAISFGAGKQRPEPLESVLVMQQETAKHAPIARHAPRYRISAGRVGHLVDTGQSRALENDALPRRFFGQRAQDVPCQWHLRIIRPGGPIHMAADGSAAGRDQFGQPAPGALVNILRRPQRLVAHLGRDRR